MSKTFLVLFVFLGMVLAGCSAEKSEKKMSVLFDTKAEAEKAAEKINCSGAHKMGDKWMPCKNHKAHEAHQDGSDPGHHHH